MLLQCTLFIAAHLILVRDAFALVLVHAPLAFFVVVATLIASLPVTLVFGFALRAFLVCALLIAIAVST